MKIELHIRAVDDASEAQWVPDRLSLDPTVNFCVPKGYCSHVRIFHPARRLRIENGRILEAPATWKAVAALRGRTAHGLMQWPGINVLPPLDDPVMDLLLEAGHTVIDVPDEGSLPIETAIPLRRVLERHTESPDSCWIGVWEGFGGFRAGIPSTESISTRHRRWRLFRGPLRALELSFIEPRHTHQSANLLWPQDRGWFVATEIDNDSTYVGGSEDLVADLLDCSELETYAANPEDGILRDSDIVNPMSHPVGTTLVLNHQGLLSTNDEPSEAAPGSVVWKLVHRLFAHGRSRDRINFQSPAP